MKLLPDTFVKNYDKVGDNTFTKVKSQTTEKFTVYIYRRDDMNGNFRKFEVFFAKRRFKGQALPNGTVEEEDREQYPTANSFGFSAKETNTIQMAERFFSEFVDKMNRNEDTVEDDDFTEQVKSKLEVETKTSGVRGRKRIERPDLVYPTGVQFLMKQLLATNSEWTQPLAYQQIQKDMAEGVLVEVGRVKSDSGRGKPSVAYMVVTK
jgi:hypothetical protein